MAYLNQCPHCGSRKISVHRKLGAFFLIFVFVSMGIGLILLPFLPKEARCDSCGLKWKP